MDSLTLLSLQLSYVDTILIPISQMRKPRRREVKGLVQERTACELQSWTLNPGVLIPQPLLQTSAHSDFYNTLL